MILKADSEKQDLIQPLIVVLKSKIKVIPFNTKQ